MRAVYAIAVGLAAIAGTGCSAEPAESESALAAEAPPVEPGTASGYYADDDEPRLEFAYSRALSFDDAEGFGDGPFIRVFLSDKPVPVEAIAGYFRPPVEAMAEAGAVKGLILQFDPDKPEDVSYRPLYGDGNPIPSGSMNNSEGLFEKLSVANGRVSGKLKPNSFTDYVIEFDAPLQEDPVIETLTGKAARESTLVKLAIARADAVMAGDLDKAATYMTKRSAGKIADIPPELRERLPEMTRAFREDIEAVDKVVTRKNSAVATGADGTFVTFVREDGEWKLD